MISNHPVERELFHGTDKTVVESILRDGFDCNFAGKNGKYLFQNNFLFRFCSRFISTAAQKIVDAT